MMNGEKKFSVKLIVLTVVLGTAVIFGITQLVKSAKTTPEKQATALAKPTPVDTRFGLPVDSFTLVEGTIERNQFLSNILDDYGIDNTTVLQLAQKALPVFSVRNLAAGKPYTIFCTKDSTQKAQYFIYQPNSTDYVVYDLRDSMKVYTGKRPVTTETKSLSGTINSSLYETLESQHADPDLAVKLANIFAWTVDFYYTQKGDWFKIVYDQQYVNGKPIESGAIRSAEFSSRGELYKAYYFEPDSATGGEFFNEEGKSLRKAFLKAPLKFIRITSHYNLHRFHPVEKIWKAHLGTDYAAPTGTPIHTTGSGVVIASRYTRFNGNYVKIKHNGEYTTQYLHMSRRAVREGQHVVQGQVIGYVGMTGLATGPHVCYRFWKNGKQVDPLNQKFPAATPVAQKYMPAFRQLMDSENLVLNKIPVDSSGSN
ncbi:MAG: peptidoglycan DD-metalloendopeptidase family protein [Bacteroidota bacterium]|nr:peptidoglycan DD-metalloendopeptidase family protein [Bacteroidota bacterium]